MSNCFTMKKARVYYNVHRKQWSIQTHIPGRGWRLFKHANGLIMSDVVPVIHKAGQGGIPRRAYLEGEVNQFYVINKPSKDSQFKLITYNPWQDDTFIWADTKEEFTESPCVLLADDAYAL